MKVFVVLSALAAVAFARPGGIAGIHSVGPVAYAAPLAYARLVPGAPVGVDGRVVDTPEVAVAKAEHAAAHVNEKITLANEAVRSADVIALSAPVAHAVSAPVVAAPGVVSAYAAGAVASPLAYAAHGGLAVAHGVVGLAHGAPVGVDGRVVDTPAVAVAKAEHAAAHVNEKITLANEAAKNYAAAPVVVSAYSAPAVSHVVSAHGAPVVSAYAAHPQVSVW
ncbi:cuticle protein 18.7 [Cephus cinctus]|uniref:Cuticle protein 18.7 n=1 Tax=Cephus cinctus TaxID=211228 RepID=A0AAJ7BQP1_CEPCN|nr:cuticle protein 18.7 [Cephus cinctus]